ncbi:hypothetical protein [Micromonospora maris]|uniref:hypothetical protein n=1 Tax=Micromonospora maris TaxID=1003110 RepID=UPI002E145BA2|nr:hypothetical protein OG712_05325 [Micromonospora maris]
MGNKQAKLGRLVVAILAGVGLSGCGAGEPANVEVLLRMNLCVDDGARCFALGIPEAEVSLVNLDGEVLATGTSDDAGKVRLPRSGAAGEVRVVAISPLIERGRKESLLELPDEGSAHITIMANGVHSPSGN